MAGEIIAFLLLGALAGWLGGVLVKGWGFGLVGDILVGIVGAFVGGFLYSLFGFVAGGFLGELLMATIGAVVFLVLVRAIRRTAEV